MKNMVKIFALALGAAQVASAISYEYPVLYKDPKIMGTGGANTAIGGSVNALFHNPAGLAKIPVRYGWEVGVLDLSLTSGSSIFDFAEDMDEATSDKHTDDEQTQNSIDVLDAYAGKNMHIGFSTQAFSVARKFESWGLGFGLAPFSSASFNIKTHRGDSSDGVLEVSGLVVSGLSLGASKDMSDLSVGQYNLPPMSFGFGLKSVSYGAVNHPFSLSEFVDQKEDLGDYVNDELMIEGSTTVFDMGLIADLTPELSVGASVMNIGGIGVKGVAEVPMTVNVGVGYTLAFEDRMFFSQTRFAADYIDLTQAHEDASYLKRTRLGADVAIWDRWFSTLALQVGLYQGHMSYGMDLRGGPIRFTYAAYSEEVGAYSGQDPDKRQMLNLHIGW